MLPAKKNRILPLLWAVLVWWTAYALFFASQVVAMGETDGRPVAWGEALKYSFAGWMTWVPLSLGFYWLALRHPIERGHLARPIALHLLAVAGVIVAKAIYVWYSNPWLGWYDALPGFGEVLLTSVRNNFMTAWTVIGVAHGYVYYQRARERELRIAEMERSLVSTRLEALRAQLNPHFLFNALNSVAEMVHIDGELADRMLVALSALLRDALKQEPQQERSLREEITAIEHYLTIEKIRLGERLQVRWDIEPACLDAPVPVLILQPLVENAIVHAIARRKANGVLAIAAGEAGDALSLRVENSAAPDDGDRRGNGIGLRSVADRLQLLYGERAHMRRLDLGPDSYGVELRLPLSRHPAAAARAEALA